MVTNSNLNHSVITVAHSTSTVKQSDIHLFVFFVLDFSDDESEVKSKNPYKRTTRTTATSVISEVKNKVSDKGDK